jgi:hypothetical protein
VDCMVSLIYGQLVVRFASSTGLAQKTRRWRAF